MRQTASLQRGFAVIAAVFLLVTLAVLGAAMLTFSNTQQITSAQDVLGSRAYWAARAGLDWEIQQVAASSSCPAASTSFTLDSFSLEISCVASTFDEGDTVTIIRMTSVACTQSPCGTGVGTIGYLERSVSASIEP